MKRLALAAFLVAFATPAFADNFGQPMFGYQAASPAASTYRSYDRGYRRELPRREVTTITPTRNGGTRIETRRHYGSGKRAGVRMDSGRWSRNSR